ncbi:MAG: hypothetical protein QM747_15060 [Nocardioides sp.]
MSDSSRRPHAVGSEPRFAPPSPLIVVVPGTLLVFAGLWTVTDAGSLPLGWAAFAVGQALLLMGAVASGVAWGLQLHDDNRR